MDYKVMGAVLVSLLVIGVGMKTYDLDVNDLTDLSNLTEKIGGGKGIGSFKMPDSGGKGSTKVRADFNYFGNVSDLYYSGNIRRVEVVGEDMEVSIAGFTTSDDSLVVENFSGSVEVVDGNLSLEGKTFYINVGGREFTSKKLRSIKLETSPYELAVENVSKVDFDFSSVEGNIGLNGQSIGLERTPLRLTGFSGYVKRDFEDKGFELKGFVSKGEMGEEGSKTVIGD